MMTRRIGMVPKSIRPQNHACEESATISDQGTPSNHNTVKDVAVLSDPGTPVNPDLRFQDGAFADDHILSDDTVRANRDGGVN